MYNPNVTGFFYFFLKKYIYIYIYIYKVHWLMIFHRNKKTDANYVDDQTLCTNTPA